MKSKILPIKLSIIPVLFALVIPVKQGQARDDPGRPVVKETIAQLDAEAAQAKRRVTEIINQPIRHLPRNDEAGEFSPGWFHRGAIKPDFNTVDLRATQSFPYSGYTYVTSDLNPSEMFVASELEFNTMTKYFYTDRTLPKKRLSEGEMLELNRLYRIIGRDEQAHATSWETPAAMVIAALVGLLAYLVMRRIG